MGLHYLEKVLAPESVTVIGASARADSVGGRVFANMIEAGYSGELIPVNRKYKEILGKPCFSSVEAIGRPVDLAVIIVPATAVPEPSGSAATLSSHNMNDRCIKHDENG